jgi:cellulose synthase/poly-beta-1,6-N-acetylglucosamine synthase-like glycosyltransferase
MTLLAIITSVLLLLYAAVLFYYYQGWNALPAQDEIPPDFQPLTRITVLIPARNEASNIRACLDSYLKQSYPAALRECIVIDDHSDDDTAAIVQEYINQGIQLIRLADSTAGLTLNSYKKKAIETGINAASGVLLLTTDADCILPPDWILEQVYYQQITGACFITGPVKISAGHSFLNRFQALDFISLQGITGASAFKGLHAMSNGANLAYLKSAFLEVNGFEGIDQLASGDDMLLQQKISMRFPGQTGYLKSKKAIVETAAMPDLKSFLQQRIRWASKAGSYQESSLRFILLLVYLLNLLLLCLLISAIFIPAIGWIVLPAILLKILIEWPFMFLVGQFFGYSRLVLSFPLFQLFHIIYTVAAGTFGQVGSYRWKGRNVR